MTVRLQVRSHRFGPWNSLESAALHVAPRDDAETPPPSVCIELLYVQFGAAACTEQCDGHSLQGLTFQKWTSPSRLDGTRHPSSWAPFSSKCHIFFDVCSSVVLSQYQFPLSFVDGEQTITGLDNGSCTATHHSQRLKVWPSYKR